MAVLFPLTHPEAQIGMGIFYFTRFPQFSRNFLAIFLQFSEKAVKKRFICRFSEAFRIIRDCLGKAEQFLKTAFVYPSDLLKSLDIINFF